MHLCGHGQLAVPPAAAVRREIERLRRVALVRVRAPCAADISQHSAYALAAVWQCLGPREFLLRLNQSVHVGR